jgi:hypothetical protein
MIPRYKKGSITEPRPLNPWNPMRTLGSGLLESNLAYTHQPSKKDVEEYSKYFPGTDIDTLRKAFDATTQYGSKGATQGHTHPLQPDSVTQSHPKPTKETQRSSNGYAIQQHTGI